MRIGDVRPSDIEIYVESGWVRCNNDYCKNDDYPYSPDAISDMPSKDSCAECNSHLCDV